MESAHKTLGRMLTALTEGKQEAWQTYLPAALFAMRTSVNRSTGFAPYRLLFGREPCTDLETMFSKPNQPEEFKDYDDYAIQLKDRIHQSFKWAQDNIGVAVRRQRRAYCQKQKKYSLGQKVWLFTPRRKVGESGKYKVWWTGPWSISKVINDLTYELEPHPSWPRKGKETVSIDRLMEFHTDEDDEAGATDAHAPGKDDDLSMEGDEHAENFGLPRAADDDDSGDEDLFGYDPVAPQQAPADDDAAEGEGRLLELFEAEDPERLQPDYSSDDDRPPVRQEQGREGQGEGRQPLLQPGRLVLPAAAGAAPRPATPAPRTPAHPGFGLHTPPFGLGTPQTPPFRTPEGASPRGLSPRPPFVVQRQRREAGAGALPSFELPPTVQEENPFRRDDPKRGKPLHTREAEYRKAKEKEGEEKKRKRQEKDEERAARIRRRETKEKEKEDGRKYGFVPDLD